MRAPDARVPLPGSGQAGVTLTAPTDAFAIQRSFDDLGRPLSAVTFVVLDVETTGGAPSVGNLTEIAAARYVGGELSGTYQTLVKPDDRIPPYITAMTGISDEMVADAPPAGAVLPSLVEFVGDGVLVGHNVGFDLSFLDHAMESTGRERLSANRRVVDTLKLARRLVRDEVPNCKLGTLAAVFDLDHQPSHRALADVLATGDLLHLLLQRAGTFGITGLGDLLDLPRLVGHPQAAKLRLTNHLPRSPGVYWFTSQAGEVLYVGKATDLRSRVRSYFTGDDRRKVGALLKAMSGIGHHALPSLLEAEVLEARLLRSLTPRFNRVGTSKRLAKRARPGSDSPPAGADGSDGSGSISAPGAAGTERSSPDVHRGTTPGTGGPDPAPATSRRRKREAAETPETLRRCIERMHRFAAARDYERAAEVRDEALTIRHRLVVRRRVRTWEASGRVRIEHAGGGSVEIVDGILQLPVPDVEAALGVGCAEADTSGAFADLERNLVARWVEREGSGVTIVEVESVEGGDAVPLASPVWRIPEVDGAAASGTGDLSACGAGR